MSLVEIAEQLERVTSMIEAQRVKEREARKAYEAIAQQVEQSIASIRGHARELVAAQERRVSSFHAMVGHSSGSGGGASAGRRGGATREASGPRSGGDGSPRNIGDAIIAIWDIERFREPLTTEEIAEALPATGYSSNAAPTSLKSSVNQALAKLCRAGRVLRFRSDGTRIPARDTKSRARKYIAAAYGQDE